LALNVTFKVGKFFPKGLYSTCNGWKRARNNFRHRLAAANGLPDYLIQFEVNDMEVCE